MDSAAYNSIEWTLPPEADTSKISTSFEILDNEYRNTLMFTPLSGRDSGVYVCYANISGEFVTGSYNQTAITLSVESEPTNMIVVLLIFHNNYKW